jgi:NADP-dependent 3-hydroxy acid dehydrogenase YdfG
VTQPVDPVRSDDRAGALAGRVALVTGGSSGIGRAVVLALDRQGCRSWAVGRSAEKLASVVHDTGGRARAIAADLTDDADLRRVARTVEDAGQLDLLVHSAGAIHLGRLADAPVEQLDLQYRANVRAPYLLTQLLMPLIEASRGDIVFVNSSITVNPRPNAVQFAATQHALAGIAECLRADVNERGVRVLSVFPGRTATPRQERLFRIEGKPYSPEMLLQAEDVADAIVHAASSPRRVEILNLHLRPAVRSY